LAKKKVDQKGRIFAYWAVIYFGKYFENCESSSQIWTTFFHSASYVLILPKKGWATFFPQTLLVTLYKRAKYLQKTVA
jgi:hypothetical protein